MFGFKKIVSLWRAATAGDTNTYAESELVAPSCDLNGNPRAHVVAGSGGAGLDVTTHFGDADAIGVGSPDLVTLDTSGFLYGFNSATWDRLRSQANDGDAVAALALGLLRQASYPYLFNGATFDRQRGNVEGEALASAVRNATTSSAAITNFNGGSIALFLDVTAVTAAQTVQLTLEGRDPVSLNWVQLTSGAAVGAVGTTIYVSPNAFIDSLPRTVRVRMIHSGGGNFTYSVGYSLRG